jgi:hypothetical protein
MAACWIPFCISRGCSVGPVTTSTKDQIHITVFVQRETYLPFLADVLLPQDDCTVLLLLLCTECWSLSTVVSQGAIFVFPVLYVTSYDPWSSHGVINTLAPFDGCVKIPSREFFLFQFCLVFYSFPLFMRHFSHTLFWPTRVSYCCTGLSYWRTASHYVITDTAWKVLRVGLHKQISHTYYVPK